MSRIAIIPARGGSKRIPKKNLKNFLGKPIIAYSIEAALSSGLFDEVMVSTDDEEIASVALSYGASVPFLRSSENSDDFATTIDVIDEVLKAYEKNGILYSNVCCIYPTSPLLKTESLNLGLSLMNKKKFDSVFPVVSYSYPIWRSVKVLDDGKVEMFWPNNLNARSQDLQAAFHDAGQFYWFDVSKFNKDCTVFGPNSGVIKLNELEVQDIDTLVDWKIAEIKYNILNEKKDSYKS